MSESMRDELHDRMLETALEEKLGAVKAPSMASKVCDSLKPEIAKPVAAKRRWRRIASGASIVAAGITAVVMLPGGPFENRSTFSVARHEPRNSSGELDRRDFKSTYDKTPVLPAHGNAVHESEYARSDKRLKPMRRGDLNGDLLVEDQTIIREGTTVPLAGAGKVSDEKELEYPYYTTRGPRDAFVRGGKGAKVAKDEWTSDSKASVASEESFTRGVDRNSIDINGDGIEDDFADTDKSSAGNRYAQLNDNPFQTATASPLSTFSIDVDTASYSVLRTLITSGRQIPPPAVRIEELVNYFPYEYAQPADGAPFAVHVDAAGCPWQPKHRLVRIALKGREISKEKRPPSNLVFLVDVSGSMGEPNKLPLVQQGLRRLVEQLDERDRVAIVVYAGNSGCVLPSTVCTGENKERIQSSVAALASGGSTNGEAGIQLAYQIAQDHFVKDGSNRVILCTDGDFNVGTTSVDELKSMVADRAKRTGVFFTALGFGMGNLNDHLLEAIADNGNGAYGYIDNEREVEKLFVKQLSGTLVTIAKDVKIQIEFNPAQVAGYRLIGYENRMLKKEDFNNDAKDAGDIGAGHTVTALYEIVPAGQAIDEPAKEGAKAGEAGGAAEGNGKAVDDLEFQKPKAQLEVTDAAKTSGDMMVVKLRYKAPDGERSTLIRQTLKDAGTTFAAASSDFKFAASVAAFGMILRRSPYRGEMSLSAVEEIAAANVGADQGGLRAEFVGMVRTVKTGGRE